MRLRYLYHEKNKRHVTEGELLALVEKLRGNDTMTIQKEIGTGYSIQIVEAEEPKPQKEFEG